MTIAIDPAIARAETIPAAWYLDPAMLDRERERVFFRTWQPLARNDQLGEPGACLPVDLLGEPLLLTRDAEVTRLLSNVCRHRACPVVEAPQIRKRLQCPYHGWTYHLDGRLNAAPDFDGVEGWDNAAVQLPAYALETWGPFLFGQLDPSGPSFADVLGDIPSEIDQAGYRLDQYRFLCRKEYVVACNWKVYIDNYLEGYHIPMVHPELFKALDYRGYRVDTRRYHSLQKALARTAGPGPEATVLYYWLFPNFMVNIYPDNLSSNLVFPLGHDRTLTIFEWYLPEAAWRHRHGPPTEAETDALAGFSDRVQGEDIAICEAVQKGLRSRTYQRGRYSPSRENGVHHFHRLLTAFLGG